MSQTEQLEKWFNQNRSLTVLEAIEKLGIYALSQRCGELRRQGYPVEGTMVTLPNGKRVMRYRKAKQDLISRVKAA